MIFVVGISRGNTLSLSMNIACSSCLLPSFSFTISGKTMNYCHCTGLKNKNGSLCLHDGFFSIHKRTCNKLECTCIFCHITSTLPCSNLNGAVHIFPGKPEMSMNSSTSMRNNTYLLTLQANCATIWWEKCDNSWLALTIKFVFLQESLSKVLTNQNMFSKQNQMSMLHRGWQWAFKSKGFFFLFYKENVTENCAEFTMNSKWLGSMACLKHWACCATRQ